MPSSIFWKTEKRELFNDQNSIWTSVEAGVLQGSDVDLLLLSTFINDLVKYQMQNYSPVILHSFVLLKMQMYQQKIWTTIQLKSVMGHFNEK